MYYQLSTISLHGRLFWRWALTILLWLLDLLHVKWPCFVPYLVPALENFTNLQHWVQPFPRWSSSFSRFDLTVDPWNKKIKKRKRWRNYGIWHFIRIMKWFVLSLIKLLTGLSNIKSLSYQNWKLLRCFKSTFVSFY